MSEAVQFLKIEDLAARWGVDARTAKRLVKAGKAPYIDLSPGGSMRINWNTVCFQLEAIEEWEQERLKAMKERERAKLERPSPRRAVAPVKDWRDWR